MMLKAIDSEKIFSFRCPMVSLQKKIGRPLSEMICWYIKHDIARVPFYKVFYRQNDDSI